MSRDKKPDFTPEEAQARFDTILRASCRIPPKDAEEAALRKSIVDGWNEGTKTNHREDDDDGSVAER